MTTPFSPLLQGSGALLNAQSQPVVGNLAATESSADSFATSGKVLVKGAATAAEAATPDAFASSGKVLVKGTLAATESGADSFASSGTLTTPSATGNLSATESGADSFAASGKVFVKGALVAVESGADSFASSGKAIVQGALVVAEVGEDALYATNRVETAGTLAAQEVGEDAAAADGFVSALPPIYGACTATESGYDAFFAVGVRLRSSEEQLGGIWTFYVWTLGAKFFDAIRQIALLQPTEPVRSGYYRTLFSIEAFNDSMATIRDRLQTVGIVNVAKAPAAAPKKSPERRPASPKTVSSVPDKGRRLPLETGVPGVASRSERWVPDPVAESMARAVDAMAAEARRAQRVFRVRQADATRAEVVSLAQAQAERRAAEAEKRLALRRKAAAMLLLAA